MGKQKIERIRPSLPPSVRVTPTGIYDGAVGQEYPCNSSARLVLVHCDGRTELGEIGSAISQETGAPYAEVLSGVLQMVRQLNGAYLLNLYGASSVLQEAWAIVAMLLRFIGWPAAVFEVTHRTAAPASTLQLFWELLHTVWLALRAPLFLAAVCLALPAAYLGYGAIFIGLVFSFFVAVFVHELGHVWALYRCGFRSDRIFLGAGVGRVFIGRQPTGDAVETVVGLAGPSLSAMLGVLLLAGGTLLQQEWLLILAIPFVLQLLTLLPVFDDNKVLQRLWVHMLTRPHTQGPEEVDLRMKWVHVWRVLASILSIYVALIVLSFLVTVAADMAGAGSFQIAIGPVEVYQFAKEADSFQGSLGGGGFWLAVLLGLLTSLLPQLLHRTQREER